MCTGACRAWETRLKGVFRVYLKGRHGANPASPFSKNIFSQELKHNTATTCQKNENVRI